VFWCCAALAYPLAAKGGYAGGIGAAVIFFLSALFLAYVLASGALSFVVDAKRSCLPGSRRLARRAGLLAALLLLPVIVLAIAALAGNPAWPPWVPAALVLATALAGVMAPRRPSLAAGLLLPVVIAAWWSASERSGHEHGKEWLFLAAALVLLAAAVPLLAAVRWRQVIRWGSGSWSLTERLRAICIRIDQGEALKHAASRASSRSDSWQPKLPVQIVRTCLGGVFVQLSRRLIIGVVLLSLFVVAATCLPWLSPTGRRWAVITLALVVAGLVSSGFLTQLPNLTRGQIAELALMPGLGAPPAQRRALCRAVLIPPLQWLGVVLLFGSADLLLEGQPLSSVSMLAMCLCIIWLTYTVFALQKLATLPPKRQSFISEFLMLYVVVYSSGVYYWVFATHPQFRHWSWFWITPVLCSLVLASVIGFAVRRLATAPHPFLASESAPG
jgi:hypothetical protein